MGWPLPGASGEAIAGVEGAAHCLHSGFSLHLGIEVLRFLHGALEGRLVIVAAQARYALGDFAAGRAVPRWVR